MGRGRALPRLGHAGPEKETEPIKNLRKMQTQQTLASQEPSAEEARREEVLALVAATSPGKSADELLDAYLKKMQSKRGVVAGGAATAEGPRQLAKRDSIRELVTEVDP